MTPQYIVLVGAARSGTKMVRDTLASATGIGAVPYDIGYVWRYGNVSHPDDTLAGVPLDQHVNRFIRGFISRYAAGDPPAVIEKTVGNVMRVAFVAQTLPSAKFLHLIRDGVDVIESTRRQWTAPTDLRYLARKARHFPIRLTPTYGLEFIRSRIQRYQSDERRVGEWGPRYPGMGADLAAGTDLLTICARQWRESVSRARTAFAGLDVPVAEIRYEEIVTDPELAVTEMARFLGLVADPVGVRRAVATIADQHRGTGRRALTEAELIVVQREAGAALAEFGYPPAYEMEGHAGEVRSA